MRLLERAAIALASLALSVGLIALLSGFFAARDAPGVAAGSGPGIRLPDLGDRLLGPGALRPPYASSPPTSGPHRPAAVTRDAVRLSDDQLLQALSAGDVVLAYGTPRPPGGLRALADSVAGAFSPALAAAGQAVVLDRVPALRGLLGLAWAHLIRARSARDAALRAFAVYWLGRGASGP